MTVLIVDDTAILRSVLKDILADFCDIQRRNIHEAADGLQALTEYRRIYPDIVFLDIAMPNLNGIDAVKRIKEIDSSARIVMCTSAGGQSVVKECMRAGALDYLVKPLAPERVVSSVKKVIAAIPLAFDRIDELNELDEAAESDEQNQQ